MKSNVEVIFSIIIIIIFFALFRFKMNVWARSAMTTRYGCRKYNMPSPCVYSKFGKKCIPIGIILSRETPWKWRTKQKIKKMFLKKVRLMVLMHKSNALGHTNHYPLFPHPWLTTPLQRYTHYIRGRRGSTSWQFGPTAAAAAAKLTTAALSEARIFLFPYKFMGYTRRDH